MTAALTLLIVALAFVGVSVYVSIAVAVMVIVRRRVMEVTCQATKAGHGPGYSDHLYCESLTTHWFGPMCAGVVWPVAAIPLLILARLYRDQVSLARIDRMERELGMRR